MLDGVAGGSSSSPVKWAEYVGISPPVASGLGRRGGRTFHLRYDISAEHLQAYDRTTVL